MLLLLCLSRVVDTLANTNDRIEKSHVANSCLYVKREWRAAGSLALGAAGQDVLPLCGQDVGGRRRMSVLGPVQAHSSATQPNLTLQIRLSR